MSDIRHWRWDEATARVYEDTTFEKLSTGEIETDTEVIAVVHSNSAADPHFGDGPVLAASRRMLGALMKLVGVCEESREGIGVRLECTSCACEIAPEGYCGCAPDEKDPVTYQQRCEARAILKETYDQ